MSLLSLEKKRTPNFQKLRKEQYQYKMAKSKNHTNKNDSNKQHRNGIKKAKNYKHQSNKGVDPKFIRNMKYARAGNAKKNVENSKKI